jgi:hypothetical protein
MAGEVWFGTKEHSLWVAAPAVDVEASKQGFASQAAFIGGGAWVRRSKTAARTYSMSWNMRTQDEVQPILDFADGIYGNGFIYYSDPFTAGRNAFPPYWAAPHMNYYDGPAIVDNVRPTLIDNGASVNGYPVEAAQYTITSTSKVPSIFIPIPIGYTIHIGAHGALQSGNATVTATPVVSALANGTTVNLTLLTTASTTRTNYSLARTTGVIGVTVSLKSTSTGVIQLGGLIAQVLPDGQSPVAGGFISGQGASGMQFSAQPSLSQYSAHFDRVGVNANLVETEAWTWQ